jgi:hypothetical protein
MKLSTLAEQLRQELRRRTNLPRQLINCTPDPVVIESYITCSNCGTRWVDEETLPALIHRANNSEEFLDLVGELSEHSH